MMQDVSCSACASKTIDFYMLDETNFTKFNANPCASGAVSVAGKTGVSKGENLPISAPADGWYYIVMFNNCSNFSDRNVTYVRTGTNADEAIDVMRSTYVTLQQSGVTYVNINQDFFSPNISQTIRLPETSLADNAANCVDGSMLFSSIIERTNLEPVVIYIKGHAFVGVRSGPGSSLVWPVETTMVGTNSFDEAFNEAINEYNQNQHVADLDIKEARAAGLTPIPK